jgi:hypothetical protein
VLEAKPQRGAFFPFRNPRHGYPEGQGPHMG